MLEEKIKKAILKDSEISFETFMQMALYDKTDGYYCKARPKLGKAGDFTTVPIASKLFSKCLARQIEEVISTLQWHEYSIVEFGPGDGTLAADLNQHLITSPQHYHFIEISPSLRATQQAKMESLDLAVQCHWHESLKPPLEKCIVIANELLDAFPVTRFTFHEGQPYPVNIQLIDGQLCQGRAPASQKVTQAVEHIRKNLPEDPFIEGYTSEINFEIATWFEKLAPLLSHSVLFIADYGYPRHEYYHPDRKDGTLMCYHQHKSYLDPLRAIGEQDITAHVDFTAVAMAGLDWGLELLGFCPQSAFLLGNGLLEDQETTMDAQDIKFLTHPNYTGESFKVIAFATQDVQQHLEQLSGFQLLDHCHRL